jgi:hypothetical protein
VQHDVARLSQSYRRGLRFRATRLRGLMVAAGLAMLCWLGATLGTAVVAGALPAALSLAALSSLSPVMAGLVLFIAGIAVLCLAIYVIGGLSIATARKERAKIAAE